MNLLELAEACERADGADGLLDVAIGKAVGVVSHGDGWGAPAFTGSLDAAMQLVPEGWVVASLSIWPASPEHADNKSAPQSNCELFGTSVSRMARKMIWGHGSTDGKAIGNAKTAPLAICAAALRARHAMAMEEK